MSHAKNVDNLHQIHGYVGLYKDNYKGIIVSDDGGETW